MGFSSYSRLCALKRDHAGADTSALEADRAGYGV
jgi:hypothetical protein